MDSGGTKRQKAVPCLNYGFMTLSENYAPFFSLFVRFSVRLQALQHNLAFGRCQHDAPGQARLRR